MFDKILAAVDGSTNSDRALEAAARLAGLEGAELVVCHAFTIPEQYKTDLVDELEEGLVADAEAILSHAVRRAAKTGVEAGSRLLREGPPADAVASAAREWGADLIVAGVRGRTPDESRPMGSVSRAIVECAPCSVLLVRRRV
jgi:nucleotide-binding universal stress UspA family protein